MPPRAHRLVTLAAGAPGLNSVDPAHKLKEDESPDAYGIDLAYDGEIVSGTAPSGTARVTPALTLTENSASIPYLWYYNRLFNITNRTASTASNVLTVGAPFYKHIYYAQRYGKIAFDEDANPILTILPVEPDSLYVGKASGGYVVSNLSDLRLVASASEILQELAIPAANQAVDLDGSVYVTNTNGMTLLESGKTIEVSRKIRGATLTGSALSADYSKRRIIVGTTYVFDVGAEKWFRYSGSSFRVTTRQLTAPDWSPFAVDRAIFVIRHTSTADGSITYQTKYEDEDWSGDYVALVPYAADRYTSKSETLAQKRSSRKFQMRVTALSNLALREILVESDVKQFDDYST